MSDDAPAGSGRGPAPDATIVLVRHGESTWIAEGRFQGAADPPLSTLGRRQAALVAARLADSSTVFVSPFPAGPPLGCWHSPLQRAAATAAAIAERWDPPLALRPDGRLREIGQGAWEGRTAADIARNDGAALAGWRRDPVHVHAPGGESLSEVQGRATGFLDDLWGALAVRAAPGPPGTGTMPGGGAMPGGAAAVPFSTGERPPWAIIVAHEGLLRVLLLALLDLPLEAFWRFPFGLCGVSVVELRGGRAALRAHNLVDHLAPLAARGEMPATTPGL